MKTNMGTPPAVTRFVSRVQAAANRGAKDIVLPLAEAVELAAGLTQLLVQNKTLLEDIVVIQDRASGPQELAMDGGGFDSN